MFIEPGIYQGSSLQRSEIDSSTHLSTRTLRSAGAPNRGGSKIYKRLAPLEPGMSLLVSFTYE